MNINILVNVNVHVDFDRNNITIIMRHVCRNECAIIIRSAIQHYCYHFISIELVIDRPRKNKQNDLIDY